MVDSQQEEVTESTTVPEMSPVRRSLINFYNLRAALQLISNRIRSPSTYQLPNASTSKQIYGSSVNLHPGLQFLTFHSRGIHGEPGSSSPTMKGKNEEDKDHNQLPPAATPVAPPVAPPSPKPTFPSWVKWVVGSILAVILPFWKQKWDQLKAIEGAAEVVVEEVKEVAEVIEKVADEAEKVAEAAVDKIPEDGPLKKAAELAELVSKEVAKEAHTTEEIIHTVEVLKEEVESLLDPLGTKGKDAKGQK